MEKISKDAYDGVFSVGDIIYKGIMSNNPYVIREITAEDYIVEPARKTAFNDRYIVERAEKLTFDKLLLTAQNYLKDDNAKTVYATVGEICDKMSIDELKDFFCAELLGGENTLRYYMTEQITGAVINRIRYEKNYNGGCKNEEN